MVEFSKMMRREKRPKSGGRRRAGTGTGGLSLRDLTSRRRKQSADESQPIPGDSQVTIEERNLLYTQAAEYLTMAFDSVKADKRFSLQPGFKILDKIVDTRTPIDALFLRAIHDEESYDLMINPSVNVAIYAIKMAENLGFTKTRQVEIGMVGLLHDIGMARIKEELIYKQNLTNDEFLIFKKRPKYGYDILQAFSQDYAYLAKCALQIHERIDGSGYPRGLQADEINESAQIIGLVDIYEALIHSRPQRERILHFYAVKEIIKTGKDKFQQRYLKALLNTFSIFPLNSYVRLNSGAIGRVIRTYPEQPMRPKVQIIYDSQSKRVLTERYINLPEHSLLYIIDSVSEQELLDLSEAAYLVTKPGQPQPGKDHSGPEPAPRTETEPPVGVKRAEKKSVPSLTAARAAKAKSTLPKKVLLILAVLFLIAGLAWQFLAPPSPDEYGDTAVVNSPPAGERVEPGLPARTPDAAKLTIKPPPVEKLEPGMPGAQAADSDDRAGQAANASEAAKPAAGKVPAKPESLTTELKADAESGPAINNGGTAGNLPPVGPDEKITPPEPGAYPYSILLASFRKVSLAEGAVSQYQNRGLDPFWVQVDLDEKGIWYRVYNGTYNGKSEAQAARTQFGLADALIKRIRYATWIGGYRDQQTLSKKRDELQDLNFSTYVIQDRHGASQLYVGAFLSQKGAQDQYASLKKAGIESLIVQR